MRFGAVDAHRMNVRRVYTKFSIVVGLIAILAQVSICKIAIFLIEMVKW